MKKESKLFSGHFYMFGLLLVFVFALIPCMGMVNINAQEIEYTVTFNQTEARTMLDSINEFRTSKDAWYWNQDNKTKKECSGLKKLKYDYELEKVAMQRAAEIAIHWGHERPDGSSCYVAYYDLGYTPEKTCGENLAAGQSTALEAYTGLREDDDMYEGQGHRRNMLNADYTAVGIGCVIVNGRKYWVQEFSGNTPSDKATAANDKDTKVKVKVADSEISEVSLAETANYSIEAGESLSIPKFKVKVVFSNMAFKNTKNNAITLDNEFTFDSADGTYVQIKNDKMTGLKEGTGSISKKVLTKTVKADVTVKAATKPTAKPTATPEPTAKPTAKPTATPAPTPTHKPGATPALAEADIKADYSDLNFTFTDIRTNKKVTCKANDGTPKVIVMGGIGSCFNTKSTMISLSDYLPKVDGKLDIYCIDIKDNTIDTMTNWLQSAGIDAKIYNGSLGEFDTQYKMYSKILAAIPETKGRWTMPAVIYINGKGKVAATTAGFQYPETVKSNLEKIVYFIPDPTPEPTKEVTPEPTKEVTPEPTKEVTPEPTKEVTPEPTKEVTPEPTKEVTPEPTKEVTPEPTKEVTPEPTKEVTPEPTKEVTPEPTKEVTPEPTKEVTPEPTKEVTPEPTKEVTPEPTEEVTPEPTKEVTPEPTKEVTPEPTKEVKPEPENKGILYDSAFTFKDVSRDTNTEVDFSDGKAKIIVLSDLLNCWYTMDMLDTIYSSVADKECTLYAIDIAGSRKTTIYYYLENYYLENTFDCGTESSINAKGELDWAAIKQEFMNAAGANKKSSSKRKKSNSFSTPLIVYVDGAGNIVKATTGYVSNNDIYKYIADLTGEQVDKSGKKADGTPEIISTKTSKTGVITQTVLKTDILGGQTLTVSKLDEVGGFVNTKYVVKGKLLKLEGFTTLESTVSIPGKVKLEGQNYYVKWIGRKAYLGNETVREINIGKHVSKIYKYAFKDMKNLTEINITAGKLKYIGKKAFKGISENAVFNIKGTKEQFESIKAMIVASGVAETVTFNHVEA